jgi:hypothetical protein
MQQKPAAERRPPKGAVVSYEERFAVSDIGPRGVQLHEVRGDIAVVSYFVPHAGVDYPVGATTEVYRAAQEQRHEVPVVDLYDTYEQARDEAVSRSRAIAGLGGEAS